MNNEVREKKPWPQYVAAFLLNDMAGACKRRGMRIETCGIDPKTIGYLLQLNYDGHIDRKTARESLNYMLDIREKTKAELNDFILHIKDRLNEQRSPATAK